MPTTITETPADVVILGVGYMSGVIAAELSDPLLNNGKAYNVVAITKGPYWDYVNDFSTTKYDEWGVGLGRKYDSPLPLQSTTIRNTPYQFALPVRRYTMPIQYHALGHGWDVKAHGGTRCYHRPILGIRALLTPLTRTMTSRTGLSSTTSTSLTMYSGRMLMDSAETTMGVLTIRDLTPAAIHG